jgi:hypothetical protein
MGLTTLLSNSQNRDYGPYSLINTTMDIRELENFKLDDAVKFHKKLNPALWTEKHKLDPEVRKQLLLIADDFVTYLGLKNLDVEDVRISGSNAAYSYTPNSDLDLHIIVDMNKLSNDDVYKELFAAKKTTYNDEHEIKVHGVPVELYVQDSNQVHHSLGEYSLVYDDWIRIPKKQRANFNQQATKLKYEKLGHLIELTLKSNNLNKVRSVIDILKRYRQAGLDEHGEFGPENLAYKALRKLGYVKKLYDYKNKLHSKKLSIEEQIDKPALSIDDLIRKYGEDKILRVLELGIQKELEKTDDLQTAFKLALANLNQNLNYYTEKTQEDWHPNDIPPGPEFKPTMPQGTVRVDVSDVYDWYKLGQNISNLDKVDKSQFGKGPPSTIMAFGDEDIEHKYINALQSLGLDTTDIDPIDPKQPKGMKRQKVDPTYNVGVAESASGYIPSKAEKNDPRFKTALTVDIKPNSLQKNAKAFGFKVSRAGVPPLLRK